MTAAHRPARPPGPPNVLLVAPLPPPRGGIATWTESILAWAARTGDIRVEVVDTSPKWRPVHDLRRWKRALRGLAQAPRDVARFLARAWRAKPDAVHLVTSGDLALARDACVFLLARALRLRTVYHLHFGWLPQTARSHGFERAGFWITLRLCDVVVVLDQDAAEAVTRMRRAATVVLMPHFIDTAVWTPRAARRPVAAESTTRLLYVGWITEWKGMRELAEACAGLPARIDFELVLAGPSDPRLLEEMRAAAGPAGRSLRVVGEVPREQVREHMSNADVFVLPSHSEGFPYVILEAMSMGLAVVSTSVGAVPQMLGGSDAPAGLLVPPRDAPALARALERVITDTELRRELQIRARRVVEQRFTLDAVRGAYLDLWTGHTPLPGAR